MRLPAGEYDKVGLRLQVSTKSGYGIGLGTYLWRDEILLDSGKKILGRNFNLAVVPPSEVPPFVVDLPNDTRVFESDGRLINTRHWLHKGEKVRIEKIAVMPWNHGDYVAGKIIYRGIPYWLLMSELELPVEPHLKLVG